MPQLFGLARLGRDVELRYPTQGGDAVCNLSLAFNYGRKGEDGKRPTAWVEGVLWGKRAEALAPYLLRGVSVAITLDEVHLETYTARDNTVGTKMIGRVMAIDLAGSPAAAPAAARAPAPAPAPPPRAAPASRPAAAGPSEYPDMDDVPF